MAMSLMTNTSSLSGQRHLGKTNTNLNKSLQRLSSGFRINTAMDDAAGLGVSERMRSQIRGLGQAERNANDGLSIIQTAEGAMGEISDILIRMRELSVQSANDSITDTERGYLDTEFTDLASEMDRISQATRFNSTTLMDGTFATTGLDFQIGHENGANFRITVTIADSSAAGLGFAGTESVGTKADSQSVMATIDAALDTLNDNRASLGAKGNRLQTAASAVAVQRENLSAANSRIRDTDVAAETSQMSKNQVLMQAGVSMLAQANSQPQMALSLLQ
ncbi:MAG: flagellin [Myxococcota bacterium]|jgi:flagellin